MLLFINVFDKLSFYSRETLALPPMPFKKCKLSILKELLLLLCSFVLLYLLISCYSDFRRNAPKLIPCWHVPLSRAYHLFFCPSPQHKQVSTHHF